MKLTGFFALFALISFSAASTAQAGMAISKNEYPKLDFTLAKAVAEAKAQGLGLDTLTFTGLMNLKGRYGQDEAQALLKGIKVRMVIPSDTATIVTFTGSLEAILAATELSELVSVQGARPVFAFQAQPSGLFVKEGQYLINVQSIIDDEEDVYTAYGFEKFCYQGNSQAVIARMKKWVSTGYFFSGGGGGFAFKSLTLIRGFASYDLQLVLEDEVVPGEFKSVMIKPCSFKL